MLRWEGSPVEFAKFSPRQRLVAEFIARRWEAMQQRDGETGEGRKSTLMDLAAVHHRTPLNLEALAVASDFELAHDVGGIRRHLNRRTGELEDCFVPRFLRRVAP